MLKLMQRVVMLLVISITIIINFEGCADKECKPVLIPQKCVVPHVLEPLLDQTVCKDTDYACIVSKAMRNYEIQKHYAIELEVNSRFCQ